MVLSKMPVAPSSSVLAPAISRLFLPSKLDCLVRKSFVDPEDHGADVEGVRRHQQLAPGA